MLVAVLVPTADSRDSRHVCEVWTKQDHPAPRMGFSELTSGPGVEAKAWEETQDQEDAEFAEVVCLLSTVKVTCNVLLNEKCSILKKNSFFTDTHQHTI